MNTNTHGTCVACQEYTSLSRRRFLKFSGAGLAAAGIPAWLPNVVFAKDHRADRQVIVSIFLRGGADGLTLCVPHGDPLYYATSGPTARPTLAIPRPGQANGCTNLDGFFGLPPAMSGLFEPYNNGHLAVVHATGLNDPTRSHFDAMRYMEVGVPGNSPVFTGWLGRHLQVMPPADPLAVLRGIGMGTYSTPMTMSGGPQTTPVPYPEYYGLGGYWESRTQRLNAIGQMYNSAPAYLKNAAQTAKNTIDLLASIDFANYQPSNGAVYPDTSFGYALKSSAALIKANVGVEAVCVDRGDWDTHSEQGPLTGHLAENMTDLAAGVLAFYRDVFPTNSNIVVVAMSEFGRRAEENASQGTDHGHGNCMFVMGGTVKGKKVYTKQQFGGTTPGWPGLGNLFEDLDVPITIDYRDILGEIVSKALGNTNLPAVFPGYTPNFQGILP